MIYKSKYLGTASEVLGEREHLPLLSSGFIFIYLLVEYAGLRVPELVDALLDVTHPEYIA